MNYYLIRIARVHGSQPARWQLAHGLYGERNGFEPYVVLPWKWDATPNCSKTICRFLNAPNSPFPVSRQEFNHAQIVRFEPGKGTQVYGPAPYKKGGDA